MTGRAHGEVDLSIHLAAVQIPQADLDVEPSVRGFEMRLQSQPVDGDRTEIFELDRAPQPERNLPTIWLTQAHVGRRWIGTQLPVVEVPHQMAFAVELDLDG